MIYAHESPRRGIGAYLVAGLWGMVIAILIAGNAIEAEEGGNDFFAPKVWLYLTLLTIGYVVSRGIAKAGVRDPYPHDDAGSHR